MDKKSLKHDCLAASKAKQHCTGSRGEPAGKKDREVGERVRTSAVVKAK